jgi:hypothetical protein
LSLEIMHGIIKRIPMQRAIEPFTGCVNPEPLQGKEDGGNRS